jgi:succinyl-CoA synthetase alpha subunit
MKPLQHGRIGLVSQSGGVLGALLSRAAARGVGFSKLVSTGNEADIDVLDILEYLLHDNETSVIAMYLEGLRNGARFRELAAHAARRGKPIVVHKVGRREAGARSAISQMGALAGRDDSLRSAPLLRGFRGHSPADSIGLAECIVALTEMPAQLGERLLEAEINPLFVLPAGQGAVAADALVVLGQPEDQRRG